MKITITITILLVLSLISGCWIIKNLYSLKESTLKASSKDKSLSITQMTRNNWLHPFVKKAVIEFRQESRPNFIRMCELKGVDMNEAYLGVIGTAKSDEIEFSFNSISILSIKY
jgi:hypothetical protein